MAQGIQGDPLRFVVIREPGDADQSQILAITDKSGSPFTRQLVSLMGEGNHEEARARAKDWLQPQGRIRKVSDISEPLDNLLAYLSRADDAVEVSRLSDRVLELFKVPLSDFARSGQFTQTRERIVDEIVASATLVFDDPQDATHLIEALRTLDAIKELAEGSDRSFAELNGRPVVLGAEFAGFARAIRYDLPAKEPSRGDESPARLKEKVETAFSELMGITSSHLQIQSSRSSVAMRNDAADARRPETDPELPPHRKTRPFVLSAEAIGSLSPATRELFKRANAPLESTPVQNLYDALVSLSRQVGLRPAHATTQGASVSRLSKAGRSSAISACIGDLMVVTETPQRYEAAEVAHIENVLAHEFKERLHVRERSVEEVVVTETEQSRETELDLESTEKFELSNEMTETVNQREAMEVGVSVSAGYGPYVQVDANFGYQTETNQERMRRSASKFAREVTERTVTRIKERVRQERVRRTIETVKEQNTHRIDNTPQSEHTIGIYRWVNRVSKLQTFNYGRRLLLRMVVPEPGAFLRYAQSHAPTKGMTAKPPPPFEITPRDITVDNWFDFARTFGVADVEPPPEPFKMLGWTSKSEKTTVQSFAGLLRLPDGYQAVSADVQWFFEKADAGLFRYIVGPETDGVFTDSVADLYRGRETHSLSATGELPITVAVDGLRLHIMTVNVLCKATSTLYDQWRTRVYAQLYTAFLDQKSRFEEQLAAQAAQVGIAVEGDNPAINRLVELAELKKHCVSVLVASPVFDYLGGIAEGTLGHPEVDVDVVNPSGGGLTQGHFIGFMEELFEWTNMSYTLYPYFWGRKAEWLGLMGVQTPDPLFLRFLQAGAAHVTLPVRPGKEAIALHLLATRQTWTSDFAPPPAAPEYASLVGELAATPPEIRDPVPLDDGWLVTTPTSLLILHATADLPSWSDGT